MTTCPYRKLDFYVSLSSTRLYCTVLYCARTVLYFKQYSPCWYEYSTSTGSYSTVVYSSRSVSYRSTGVSTVPHIEILQYATNTRTVAGYCNIYIQINTIRVPFRTIIIHAHRTHSQSRNAYKDYKDHTTASAPLEPARHAS